VAKIIAQAPLYNGRRGQWTKTGVEQTLTVPTKRAEAFRDWAEAQRVGDFWNAEPDEIAELDDLGGNAVFGG